MSRSAALTFGIIMGFVVLGLVAVGVLIVFPYEEAFGPTPTATATLTVTSTPTFPLLLPTASNITPTMEPPTPVNTRLPTLTPRPTKTAIPTRAFAGPTIAVPTSTPTELPTNTPEPVPSSAPRFYTLTFEVEETVIDRGECTTLKWEAVGPIALWFNGDSAENSMRMRICPRVDTTYTLEFQAAGGTQREFRRVTVEVNK